MTNLKLISISKLL